MPAYLGGRYQMAGMKWYGSNVENKKKGLPRSILMMMLNDKDTGAPLAMMSANLLSSYRTGGIPGVGCKYLAREDAKTAAIIGPGVMGKTSLRAFVSVRPGIDTVKIKGRGQRSLDSFVEFVKEECPGIKNIVICDTIEEAVRDSDIVSMTTTVSDKESEFPYIDREWIKKGAFISMPSAARFDEDFLVSGCKKVVDNYMLYEAWEEEYPYPTYDQVQIVGSKFTDLKHVGKITREDIIDIADVITGKCPGREDEDEIMKFDELVIDNLRHEALISGEVVELTFKEYELLRYLALNHSTVLSRESIMQRVWQTDFEGETRTVDMHIKTLRKKLGAVGERIKTVRNVGYMFE